jgi:uncharacterized coiled-coil protein SlyX
MEWASQYSGVLVIAVILLVGYAFARARRKQHDNSPTGEAERAAIPPASHRSPDEFTPKQLFQISRLNEATQRISELETTIRRLAEQLQDQNSVLAQLYERLWPLPDRLTAIEDVIIHAVDLRNSDSKSQNTEPEDLFQAIDDTPITETVTTLENEQPAKETFGEVTKPEFVSYDAWEQSEEEILPAGTEPVDEFMSRNFFYRLRKGFELIRMRREE